ncbi:MAG: sortase [Candidatus Woesebacteria bacterium]|nr:sortase [Candidatus Woesebacteria bacterium]
MKVVAGLIVAVVAIIIASIYWPLFQVEIGYLSDQIGSVRYVIEDVPYNTFVKVLTPVNTDFSIIIPKIAAVAPIVDEVDPNDPYRYLPALKNGIAHALGSANPGYNGNVYLFAHSGDTFYNVVKYNTVFFLLGKLSKEDEIYVYYKGRKYKYIVDQVKVVNPKEIDYLAGNPETKTLTLQTGYPAGTAMKRLIVIATDAGLQ